MKKMGIFTDEDRRRYTTIWEELEKQFDEKDKRLLAAAMTKSLGYGSQKVIIEITKLNADTIKFGTEQLNGIKVIPENGCRTLGGGRKFITEIFPDLEAELLKLVETIRQENTESPFPLTKKSLENITKELNDKDYSISKSAVSDLLAKNELEETTRVDRNSQFEYINETVKEFIKQGNPVISVDGKKKENIGNFKNNGKEYAPKGKPTEVNVYDFIDKEKGKVTPYGVFDIMQNDGWVNVGTDYDTAEFSVESIP